MKATFKSKDPLEIKRLANANNMASFIWELKHNGWRELEHTEYDYGPAWKKINELLDDYNIDIDSLTV